jgi:hypothetical protein
MNPYHFESGVTPKVDDFSGLLQNVQVWGNTLGQGTKSIPFFVDNNRSAGYTVA